MSVAIVLSTAIVNDGFRERDQDVKEMQVFDKYTTVVLEADGVEKRKLLTEYFASARVYFHIRTEAQRAKAANLVKDLGTRAEVDVPGIERLDFGPKTTELRFFRRAEEQEARQIAETITALGTPTTATYIPGYEVSANIRPRHYELWLANPSN